MLQKKVQERKLLGFIIILSFFFSLFSTHGLKLRPEGGGGVKVDFPVFTYLIRASGDKQEEKNRTEI